ncbi:methylated-DNA--[protein]-cysteine S-methyltransferase [Corynebacterium tapiri]|uniref:methylated-DNA--[protein]-cysteine S-methyltransferase n=1 Tax=Corynebacterium tapiri TaxID=1448266 RepID=A0A5C4U6C4_9CORY|nr:methylated-DNA--[protein]-cysteine S-methyltransferase [Corynebacterium tapiri]TNM00436.1 methylated-DNA--[protein]-cysteine S-methyltransferase [Corynebacterium tapiri]
MAHTHQLLDTPLGTLTVVSSSRGLVRLGFDGEDVLSLYPDSRRGEVPAAALIAAYFEGTDCLGQIAVDVENTGFQGHARQAMREIPFGQTRTYTQLAALSGSPRAVRAAGTACATNPVPLVIPCHRITRSDGSVGNYRGGHSAKIFLLEHEQRNLNGQSHV